MVRIVCISDTHTQVGSLNIPPGDILVHAGDFTDIGDVQDVMEFASDIRKIKNNFKEIICIAGNHDFCFENKYKDIAEDILLQEGIKYLHDDWVEVCGLKVYGSPYQPWFYDWAFNLQRGKELEAKWAQIPDDTNVLITHGPPYSILDGTTRGGNVGCVDLGKRIMSLPNLKLHVFGHIHEAYGIETRGSITYVNAACCDVYNNCRSRQKPIVVDI